MDLSAGAWFMVALRRSRPDHDDLRCKSLEQALDWLLDGIAIRRRARSNVEVDGGCGIPHRPGLLGVPRGSSCSSRGLLTIGKHTG